MLRSQSHLSSYMGEPQSHFHLSQIDLLLVGLGKENDVWIMYGNICGANSCATEVYVGLLSNRTQQQPTSHLSQRGKTQ